MAKTTDMASALEAGKKKYELILIFQPELLESAVEKKLKELEKFFEEGQGSVVVKDIWGKQQLAYKIGRHGAGIYVVYNLILPGSFNRELDEHLRIDKDVIRFLLVSVKEDYEYKRFEEEILPKLKEEKKYEKKFDVTSHRSGGTSSSEIKDKGKKADAGSLDDKLDALLEGEDIKV